MKNIILTVTALFLFAGISSFAGNEKTIGNLKAGFKGESTASAKYAAYAVQADKEGLKNIAILFRALSKSESIHAANHKLVLDQLGQKVDDIKPDFTVKTTKENLDDAANGETYEVITMYPGFITTANDEGVISAAKSFRWAKDTEKKHMDMCKNAAAALAAKKEATLPSVYWVCPKCGNTYDVPVPEAKCSFCETSKSRFIKFK